MVVRHSGVWHTREKKAFGTLSWLATDCDDEVAAKRRGPCCDVPWSEVVCTMGYDDGDAEGYAT